MAEYFDTEEVVKDYDRRITLRILAFLKPYPLLLVFALGALIFSTLGELMVPVLQQRLIDGAIIPRFLAIRTETLKALGPELRGPLENILASGKAFAAGEWLFFPRHGNQGNGKLLSATETELRKKSLGADLDDGEWYAFRFREGDPVAALVQSRGDIFVSREEPEGIFSAAIRNKNLYGLPRKDIAQVRAGDIRVIVRSFFFLLALLGLVFFFTFLQTWCTSLAGQKVMKDIRLALFQKTASQSTAFLSRHPVGRLVTRLTGDVETINEFFTSVLAYPL